MLHFVYKFFCHLSIRHKHTPYVNINQIRCTNRLVIIQNTEVVVRWHHCNVILRVRVLIKLECQNEIVVIRHAILWIICSITKQTQVFQLWSGLCSTSIIEHFRKRSNSRSVLHPRTKFIINMICSYHMNLQSLSTVQISQSLRRSHEIWMRNNQIISLWQCM